MTAAALHEGTIAAHIARNVLQRRCVLLVDRCNWTGSECDVLGVTVDLRIIDVEIKISRADLKADARKDKWWHRHYMAGADGRSEPIRTALEWPRKVWKHYYALPAEIWKPELADCLPSKASGVILLTTDGARLAHTVLRRATPCKEATRLRPEQVMDIARLANLRMWDAYQRAEVAREGERFAREELRAAAREPAALPRAAA